MKKNYFFASVLILFSLIFTGCKDRVMGYSVVLWDIPEYNISSGDVIPVYIRSNISHVYVAGTVDGTKIEIPLWQLTEPLKKNQVKKIYPKYEANAHTYAKVKLDGLPCRADPVNTAKQVYRLRKGEIIKILYKGKGQQVMAGKKPLEGDWYKILTNDGTQGWCFSYNLNLYESDINSQQTDIVVDETLEEDPLYQIITAGVWYPEYFDTLIRTGNIDLNRLDASFNFNIDLENNIVTLNLPKIHKSWAYTGYEKTGDKQYTLNDIPVIIVYKSARFIVVRYTGESGKPEELNFIKIEQNLDEVIEAEQNRRGESYLQLYAHGPKYISSNYGNIVFNEDGSFHWNGFKLLVPSIISSSAKTSGKASVKYSLSKSLSANYDGVITFKFNDMANEVNFLYKLDGTGLRLEDATAARINGNQIVERGSSPLVLFFSRN
ncbi:MAG: SH3 domain-containing protein [Treponema sp.]|nr:SH3 domain-containing protein [Spirochaetia bacterium]MDY2839301.1 SH3 domain-containing protein [Treponema sp.]MDY5122496.1 SH3 domain-containing protein [Treponema sp.]